MKNDYQYEYVMTSNVPILTKMIIKSESIWLEMIDEKINSTTYKVKNDLINREAINFDDEITLFNTFRFEKNEHLSNAQRLKDVLYTILLKFAHSENLSLEDAWKDYEFAFDLSDIKGLKLMGEYFNSNSAIHNKTIQIETM